MATGPEHYREAEKLITLAAQFGRDRHEWAMEYLAAARANATLAVAAAQAAQLVDRYYDQSEDAQQWLGAISYVLDDDDEMLTEGQLRGRTCTDTCERASGYGILRCRLPSGHAALLHDDQVTRVRWAAPTNVAAATGGSNADVSSVVARSWFAGDPEPQGVDKVRDIHGDVWTRDPCSVWRTPETVGCGWSYVAKKWSPLTEVVEGGDR